MAVPLGTGSELQPTRFVAGLSEQFSDGSRRVSAERWRRALFGQRQVEKEEQQARAEGEEGEQEEGAEGPRTSQQLSASERYPPTLLLSFHCLSGAPEVETRGAPLPLTAAAASLLPASRRVPGPVAGLHHTPPLLLPPTTCGLPTPFSTSFPLRRSRSCRPIHREGERSHDRLVARRSPRTRSRESRALQSEHRQTGFSRSLGAWRAT